MDSPGTSGVADHGALLHFPTSTKNPRPDEFKFVTVDALGHANPVRLRYELFGHGPTKVVMVMGLGSDYEAWNMQLEYLGKQHGDQYQVCAFDNRGAGKSSAPSIFNSVHTMAEDCIQLLKYLGWKHVHLVGISMGGMIAMEVASMAPGLLASLTLVNTHAGRSIAPFSGTYYLLKALIAAGLGFKEAAINALLRLLYGSSLDADPVRKEQIRKYHHFRLTNAYRATPRGLISHIISVTRHHVPTWRLQKIRETNLPVLICVGTDDVLVRPSNSYHIHKHIGGRLQEYEGVGHGLHIEKCEEFNTALVEHIRLANQTNKQVGRLQDLSEVSFPERSQKSTGSTVIYTLVLLSLAAAGFLYWKRRV